MLEVDALIVVPDIGTFRYTGRTPDTGTGVRNALEDALGKATLLGERRDKPYSYGVTMYASGGGALERLRGTFRTVDALTTEGEMALVGKVGGGPSGDCLARMKRQTLGKTASIVSILNDYSGVYVYSYEIRGFVPGEARWLLRN